MGLLVLCGARERTVLCTTLASEYASDCFIVESAAMAANDGVSILDVELSGAMQVKNSGVSARILFIASSSEEAADASEQSLFDGVISIDGGDPYSELELSSAAGIRLIHITKSVRKKNCWIV